VSFYPAPVPRPETVVYREVAFSVAAFDRFKHWQRHLTRKEGRYLTNGETLDRLILAMPAPEEPDRR
jgi:hypothetical protein